MADTTFPGKGLDIKVVFLDQAGVEIPTTVTPDGPPIWTDTTPATGSLTTAPDGLSSHYTTLAVGTDTVHADVIVGGVTFPADLAVNVTAGVPIVGSVRLDATPTP